MANTRPALDYLTNTGGLERLFKVPLQVYFAEGTVSPSGWPYLQEQMDQYWADNVFVPLGRLAVDAGTINVEPITAEIHGDTITTGYSIVLDINNLEVHKDMIDYFESKQNQEFTFLLIPFKGDQTVTVMFSGCMLNNSITININGDLANIAINGSVETDRPSGHLHVIEDFLDTATLMTTAAVNNVIGLKDLAGADYNNDLDTFSGSMYPSEDYSELWWLALVYRFNATQAVPLDLETCTLADLIEASFPSTIKDAIDSGFLPKSPLYRSLTNAIEV